MSIAFHSYLLRKFHECSLIIFLGLHYISPLAEKTGAETNTLACVNDSQNQGSPSAHLLFYYNLLVSVVTPTNMLFLFWALTINPKISISECEKITKINF